MRVTIHGPNFPTKDVYFHIHEASCPDLKKRFYQPYRAEAWTAEFDSFREAVIELFGDFFSENELTEEQGFQTYAPEVKAFPCTGW